MPTQAKRRIEYTTVAPGVSLWVEVIGEEHLSPVVLIMGANASGVTWPDALIDALSGRHQVVRYDHRDTGRSTRCFSDRPYPLTELSEDVLRVFDALGFEQAHVVGMSLGGTLTQLLLLDHPERIRTATLIGVAPLDGAPMPNGMELPGPSDDLLDVWARFGDERSSEDDLAFWIEHWKVLNGKGVPFDEAEFLALERRVRAHEGEAGRTFAHALASQDNLDRGNELSAVRTPTLVIDAPCDPTTPPPTAQVLTTVIPSATSVTIAGMGHAIPSAVIPDLSAAILEHIASG